MRPDWIEQHRLGSQTADYTAASNTAEAASRNWCQMHPTAAVAA